MCSVIGALLKPVRSQDQLETVNQLLNIVWNRSHERGRDGRGYRVATDSFGEAFWGDNDTSRVEFDPFKSAAWDPILFFNHYFNHGVMIGNLRAEPTTEYVDDKRSSDQQPYSLGGWSMVHNGTIANDKDLRTYQWPSSIDSSAIIEQLSQHKLNPDTRHDLFWWFYETVRVLKGSYAIIAAHTSAPNQILVATNYRPVWYVKTEVGLLFASARHYFPNGYEPQMVEPYSAWQFAYNSAGELDIMSMSLRDLRQAGKALVVCSGGLDSTVAATFAQRNLKYSVELIHFQYGSRAEGPEVKAVKAVGEALGVPVTLFPLPVYKPSDSPLLQSDSAIAGGEAGAEFAHEWVPARNLLLLSVATAYAEANGFDVLVLGNNLEEAGAYPDNEPEFIARFNDLLPFAVGDGKRLQVLMPVGNMMKHEIVALGNKIGAPMDKTWSCYRAGIEHCGTCGPCFMRRTAFHINKLPEVIPYIQE